MLDLSSIKSIPSPHSHFVFLIHDLGFERCFWALWLNSEDFQAQFAPYKYQVLEGFCEAVREKFANELPSAQELTLSNQEKTVCYRTIRRAELPEHVRHKIYQLLESERQERQLFYLSIGFETEDLSNSRQFKRRYRQLIRKHHPDMGGDPERFMQIQQAYKDMLKRYHKGF